MPGINDIYNQPEIRPRAAPVPYAELRLSISSATASARAANSDRTVGQVLWHNRHLDFLRGTRMQP